MRPYLRADEYFASGALVSPYSTPSVGRAQFEKTTYHAGIQYQVTPTSMLYAKCDTGYKAGGFSELGAYALGTIRSIEIGAKNRFAGDTIQLNISAYNYAYRGQQISQVIQNVGTLIANAGKTRQWGAEIEGQVAITRDGRFDLAVAWLDSKFTDFSISPEYRSSGTPILPDGNISLNGNRPVQAPTISINAGFQHSFHIGDGLLTARGQTQFQTEQFLSIYNFRATKQSAFSRSDFTLTYDFPGNAISIQGFVRNIEDQRIIVAADPDSTAGGFLYQFAAPRTYGARLSWKM
jgi:iron complex outermembrane receptor protein